MEFVEQAFLPPALFIISSALVPFLKLVPEPSHFTPQCSFISTLSRFGELDFTPFEEFLLEIVESFLQSFFLRQIMPQAVQPFLKTTDFIRPVIAPFIAIVIFALPFARAIPRFESFELTP